MRQRLPRAVLAVDDDALNSIVGEDAVSSLWLLFTKCKGSIADGQRLENMSWRLLYREMCPPANLRHSPPPSTSAGQLISRVTAQAPVVLVAAQASSENGHKQLPTPEDEIVSISVIPSPKAQVTAGSGTKSTSTTAPSSLISAQAPRVLITNPTPNLTPHPTPPMTPILHPTEDRPISRLSALISFNQPPVSFVPSLPKPHRMQVPNATVTSHSHVTTPTTRDNQTPGSFDSSSCLSGASSCGEMSTSNTSVTSLGTTDSHDAQHSHTSFRSSSSYSKPQTANAPLGDGPSTSMSTLRSPNATLKPSDTRSIKLLFSNLNHSSDSSSSSSQSQTESCTSGSTNESSLSQQRPLMAFFDDSLCSANQPSSMNLSSSVEPESAPSQSEKDASTNDDYSDVSQSCPRGKIAAITHRKLSSTAERDRNARRASKHLNSSKSTSRSGSRGRERGSGFGGLTMTSIKPKKKAIIQSLDEGDCASSGKSSDSKSMGADQDRNQAGVISRSLDADSIHRHDDHPCVQSAGSSSKNRLQSHSRTQSDGTKPKSKAGQGRAERKVALRKLKRVSPSLNPSQTLHAAGKDEEVLEAEAPEPVPYIQPLTRSTTLPLYAPDVVNAAAQAMASGTALLQPGNADGSVAEEASVKVGRRLVLATSESEFDSSEEDGWTDEEGSEDDGDDGEKVVDVQAPTKGSTGKSKEKERPGISGSKNKYTQQQSQARTQAQVQALQHQLQQLKRVHSQQQHQQNTNQRIPVYNLEYQNNATQAAPPAYNPTTNNRRSKPTIPPLPPSQIASAILEADRRRSLIVKLPPRSYSNNAMANREKKGLLSQLMNPDPEIFPVEHPYRRNYSSGDVKGKAPTRSMVNGFGGLGMTAINPPSQNTTTSQPEAKRRSLPPQSSTSSVKGLMAMSPVLAQGLMTAPKSAVAQPVAAVVTAGSVVNSTNPRPTLRRMNTDNGGVIAAPNGVGDKAGAIGSSNGGYKKKGRPTEQEMEDTDDESGDEAAGNKMAISDSVAQQKLAAIFDRRGAKGERRAGDNKHSPQHGVRFNVSENPKNELDRTSSSRRSPPATDGAQPVVVPYPYNLSQHAEPLSPRTTRQLMLRTEMSESLRQNLLWTRQLNRNDLIGPRRRSSGALSNLPLTNVARPPIEGLPPPLVKLRPKAPKPVSEQNKPVNPEQEEKMSDIFTLQERKRMALSRNKSWAPDMGYHQTGW